MKRIMLTGLVAGLVLAGMTPAPASVKTKRYEAGVVFPWASVEDPTGTGIAQDGTIDAGAVIFQPPFDSSTLSFTGVDDHDVAGTGRIHIAVCQDLHGDPLTCRADEAHGSGCVGETQSLVVANASTSHPVLVFVHAVSGCPNGFIVPPEFLASPAYATQGWITLAA